MKKIVIGITAPGSVLLLDGQLRYFREKGYRMFLLAPNHPRVVEFCKRESCEHLAIDIEREISLFKDFNSLIAIFKHFRKVKPDIINLGTPKVSLLGMFAGYCLRIETRIYTCRGIRFEAEKGIKRAILKAIERLIGTWSHQIICISHSVRTFAMNNKLFNPIKTIVINKGSSNGINLDRFNISRINDQLRKNKPRELGIKEEDFVFGFVGRVVDSKGIKELFLSFNDLYLKNINLKLLIIGPVEYEQVADTKLIERMECHPGVILMGSQLDVPLFMSMMDVFVLPTWREGFGNVVVEAAAMGIPIISTKVTGIKDAVSNNFNGILIKVRSIEELTNTMKLLFSNHELRNKFGRNGIEWARNFDREKIWEGINLVYKTSKADREI